MSELIGRSIRVKGKVQGVFYRASTTDTAVSLGLTGWVRNEPNGDVYMEVYGTEEALGQLISWCEKGPPLSQVSGIVVSEIAYREVSGFKVTY